jgi:hypothetical protein
LFVVVECAETLFIRALVKQLLFSFFVDAGDYKLILEFRGCSTDCRLRIFVDKFRVAF